VIFSKATAAPKTTQPIPNTPIKVLPPANQALSFAEHSAVVSLAKSAFKISF
jgi:hypothetical protein